MCGIAGIVSLNPNSPLDPKVLRRMSQRLKHRGPDDEGFVLFSKNELAVCGSNDTQKSAWKKDFPYSPHHHIEESGQDAFLAMAHRRLSVIDLSEAGHQPMCNEQGDLWIVCNGEIYNYIELRSELEEQGYTFRTRTDIEVLLKAYEHWGFRCLDRLNGMWAFVIYDRKKNVLFGARDRFGVKPLYYYHRDVFAFASEQKSLMALPQIDTEVVPEAVYEHLLLGRVEMREEGFYKNILELMPSHTFELDLETGTLNVRRYYQLSFFRDTVPFDQDRFDAFIPEIKGKIQRAVELRLRSDVPVGFCLSGGLDSSSIVCTSRQLVSNHTETLKTFTATNGYEATDESRWAELVSVFAKTQSFKAACRAEDLLPSLDEMVWHQDVPLYSTSTFAQNRVMKSARENGIVILLDGQGGDELFAGYQTFFTSNLLEHFRKSPFKGFPKEFSNLANSPSSKGIFLRSVMKIWMDEHCSPSQKDFWASRYRPELKYVQANARREHSGKLSLAGEFSSMSVNELLHHYFTSYYLKNLLRWEDRCSMQYSIESRTPFADDVELIEAVFSAPSSFKIHQGFSKVLLREAMKGIIPEEVRLRKDKLGFATPQSEWLQKIQATMKDRILELMPLDTLSMVDYPRLMKEWDIIFTKPQLWKVRDFVWRVLNYLVWRKQLLHPPKP